MNRMVLPLSWGGEGADPCSTRLPRSPCRAWEGAVGGGGSVVQALPDEGSGRQGGAVGGRKVAGCVSQAHSGPWGGGALPSFPIVVHGVPQG